MYVCTYVRGHVEARGQPGGVGPGDWTQLIKLGGQFPYLLSTLLAIIEYFMSSVPTELGWNIIVVVKHVVVPSRMELLLSLVKVAWLTAFFVTRLEMSFCLI